MFKLALIILLISCSRHVAKIAEQIHPCQAPRNLEDPKLLNCPKSKTNKFILLPATHLATGIYLGANNDPDYLSFLNILDKNLENTHIQLNVVTPNQTAFNGPQNANIISTSASDNLWAQDYFEIFSNHRGSPQIVDLPYPNRSADNTPEEIATSCKIPLIKTPPLNLKNNDGNLGGNIEAISNELVIVGDTISNTLHEWLKQNLDQEIIKLTTNWLATGHIDELFAIIPLGDDEYKIAYASPELAIEIINKTPAAQSVKLNNLQILGEETFNPEKYFLKNCLQSKNQKCKTLYLANLKYQQIINKNLQLIIKKLNISNDQTVALPVLFSPRKIKKIYGTKFDFAESINPNLINFISLNEKIFLPEQTFQPFKNYTEEKLIELGKQTIWLPSEFAQIVSGGLHCSSQVIRTCKY
jgi:hypothetical protein